MTEPKGCQKCRTWREHARGTLCAPGKILLETTLTHASKGDSEPYSQSLKAWMEHCYGVDRSTEIE